MSTFENQVIAITGAASGMGLAAAQLLASRGATISLADLNESALATAIQSLSPGKHITCVVDVRNRTSVDSWIETTVKQLGRLDGAVNMAGIIRPTTPIADLSDEDWDLTFAVNARGVMSCIRAQVKAMTAGGSIVSLANQHRGVCSQDKVSAASTFGQFGAPGNAAYCASKAAVIALTRTAAKENPHVRINCVSPGMVICI